MKLAISNIAWNQDEDEAALDLLEKLGIERVEMAPTKVWENISKVTSSQASEYLSKLEKRKISVIAFQSLLFQQDELQLFGATQEELKEHLLKVFNLAYWLGVKALVFGSPKNRKKGDLSKEEALLKASEFFIDLGKEAEKLGVYVCIEPNPEEYGADFITNLSEAIELTHKVGNKNIRPHLDTGEVFIKNEKDGVIKQALEFVKHVHISEPFLEEVGAKGSDHERVAKVLKESNYDGNISIEMKSGEDNLARMQRAIDFVQKSYL